MRMHRFYVKESLGTRTEGGVYMIENTALHHQLANVLRAKAGDPIQLFGTDGIQITGTIQDIGKGAATVSINLIEREKVNKRTATLYCAMLKRENFELVSQKATELGISAIVPLLTDRTIKTGFNRQRLEKIIIEAAEQSGQTSIPVLADPMPFADALMQPHELKLFFDMSGERLAMQHSARDVAVFVGPEGGWSDSERRAAREAELAIASVGDTVLRAETAAIIASFLATR